MPSVVDHWWTRTNPSTTNNRVAVRGTIFRGEISVVATAVTQGEEVGRLNAYKAIRPVCGAQLKWLSKKLKRKVGVFVVYDSWVDDDLRGTGLGVDMYLLAAQLAAKNHAALAAHETCADDGVTSGDAQTVWDSSRRFRAATIRPPNDLSFHVDEDGDLVGSNDRIVYLVEAKKPTTKAETRAR